jgi:hypothetical protein
MTPVFPTVSQPNSSIPLGKTAVHVHRHNLSTYFRMYACTLVPLEASRMATKKTSTPAKTKQSKKASTPDDAVALTLKVDKKTYVRLCTLRAKQMSTTQEILNDALVEHLKRLGA